MTGGQIAELEATREKYKRAALAAKAGGDRETALEMMKLIKTCDNLLLEVRQGNVVDLALIRQPETQVRRYCPAERENNMTHCRWRHLSRPLSPAQTISSRSSRKRWRSRRSLQQVR